MTILKTDTVSGIGTEGTVFEGDITFDSPNYMTLPKGTTAQANRGRGLLIGGVQPSPTPGQSISTISYIDIASSGSDIVFGDLVQARYAAGAVSSSTRAIYGGGRTPTRVTTQDYVEIATTGKALDFGSMSQSIAYNPGVSNETRGLWMGGSTPTTVGTIDFVVISTTGSRADFGDLKTGNARSGGMTVGSPTRAVLMGGYASGSYVTTIDYVQIASESDSTDFGSLTNNYGYGSGVSNGVRGIAGGGATSPSGDVNHMEYITIATLSNAKDFGDLLYSREHVGAVSNSIRGVWFGGVTPTYQTDIQYCIINTTGSAANWGDLSANIAKGYQSGASDSHGGLL